MSNKMVNGQLVAMSQAEIDARAAEEAAWAAGEFDRAMEDLRKERDELLNESDCLMLSDHPDNIRAGSTAIQNYRQNLRNITAGMSTVQDVENVSWPAKP